MKHEDSHPGMDVMFSQVKLQFFLSKGRGDDHKLSSDERNLVVDTGIPVEGTKIACISHSIIYL